MNDIAENLTQLDKKLSAEIRHLDTKTLEYFKGLGDKIGAQTEQMSRLVVSVEHSIESNRELKALISMHAMSISELRSDVAVLKEKHGGYTRIIERLGYPLILAALVTYFTYSSANGG